MSNGKTHAMVNGVVIGITLIVSTQLPRPLAVGAITGSLMGFFLTPDIDLPGITHEENRIYRHFGFVGGGMWQLFWSAYARTHSHRGSSHAPITGTLGRWWYVFKRLWWMLAITLYYYGDFILDHLFECFSIVFFMFVFNVLQDLTHLALDGWKYHHRR